MFEGPLQDVIDEFSRLPGVGPKSAQRIAFHLLQAEPTDVERLAGLGDPIDLAEADAIYRPISRLLDLYIEATRGLHAASSTFLREDIAPTPVVIGVGLLLRTT